MVFLIPTIFITYSNGLSYESTNAFSPTEQRKQLNEQAYHHQPMPFTHAVLIVQMQKFDRHSSFGRESLNHRTIPLEVIFPSLLARIEERNEITRERIE